MVAFWGSFVAIVLAIGLFLWLLTGGLITVKKSKRIPMSLIISIVIAVTSPLLVSCGSSSNNQSQDVQPISNQSNQLANDDEEVMFKVSVLRKVFSDDAKLMFEQAKFHDTIRDYEVFLKWIQEKLSSKMLDYGKIINSFDDLNHQAVHRIYEQFEQADLIEGYQYFLNHYPDTSEAKDALFRLYEASYKVAEKLNTDDSYISFINNFSAAPSEFLERAMKRYVSLQCGAVNSNYEAGRKSLKSEDSENQFYTQKLIERIGINLYNAADEAEKQGNNALFIGKHRSIQECELFYDSEVRFDISQNEKILHRLHEIENKLKVIQSDLKQSNSLILAKLDQISDVQKEQDQYLRSIQQVIEEQRETSAGQVVLTTLINYGLDSITPMPVDLVLSRLLSLSRN